MSVSPALFNSFGSGNGAIPISIIPTSAPTEGKTLDQLRTDGLLTIPVYTMPEFLYGGTSNNIPKSAGDPLPREMSDFTARDAQIFVYSLWARRGKLSKGEVSGSVYDATNHLLVRVPPKKITLVETPLRVAFSFSPAPMPPGIYRVDLNWDGKPAWRTFVRITD